MNETNENEIYEGSVIGNYRVVAMLGQGGMGTVYEVEHLELGTHYALKTFTFDPNHEASGALKRKFLEEGRLLARLKHPNLTHVFDLGFEEKTQMPYFVMDLVTYEDGDTYTVEDIDLSDIDEELVYKWFKQLASALDYIHGEGIVHRDIKPGNLLVDKDLNVILTDFGISRIFGAKIKSEVDATRTVVTKTGRGKLVLGTIQYIAPEVAAGNEATPQADAYSLGVMLLRWLTGFDYRDNPGAIALLSKKKYRWLSVIPQLLAPFGRRPENYTELLKLLKPQMKPAAKPAVEPKQPVKQLPEKKTGVFNGLIAAGIAGLLAVGGYFVWRQNDRRQQEQIAAIQKQLEEAKAEKEAEAKRIAEEKRAAEEKRIAEEKRVAEEKKVREAKLAEQRRIEESRTKIEKLDASTLTVRELPKVETAEPDPEKKPEFKVVAKLEDIKEEKDYGPIPDKKYVWGAAKSPRPVEFQLANDAVIELMPLKPGAFHMSNDKKREGRDCHKVVFTYPFWMSKFKVTVNQWRDFAPDDCDDCRKIEEAVGPEYPVSKRFSRKRVDEFCRHLSEKYRSQLPKDYVFRLPSEAEWEYAMDIPRTRMKYAKDAEPGERHWDNSVVSYGSDAGSKWAELLKTKKLESICQWHAGWDKRGWTLDNKIFVGGKQQPMVSGICDMLPCRYPDVTYSMLLDTYEGGSTIEYFAEEVDPLRWYGGSRESCRMMCRSEFSERHLLNMDCLLTFHVVLGPDLIAQKAWENKKTPWEKSETAKAASVLLKLDPKKIPQKISKEKKFILRMVSGEEMVLCAVPAVKKFNMSNCLGQEKPYHTVKLTKPFWMTKYPVTVKQWREFGPYDADPAADILEKAFPKLKICQMFNRYKITAFCKFLTERYKRILPEGYVFRLPTEAEWEWALVADKDVYAKDVRRKYIQRTQDDFVKKLEKSKELKEKLGLNAEGRCTSVSSHFVAGRTEPNKFGICDMLNLCRELVFDCYTSDFMEDYWAGKPSKNIFYEDGAENPVHWDGVLSNNTLYRGDGDGLHKGLGEQKGWYLAHIVIAPDIEPALKEKERADYPQEDFGGKFIGNMAKVYKVSSSVSEDGMGTERAQKRMLTQENVRVPFHEKKDRACGVMTKQETAPWIQIELEKKVQISGIQIESYMHSCKELRVWVSDDGVNEREVFKDERNIRLYRVDLAKKNIKAKYIRIGREPGTDRSRFCLNKILIYGK